MMLTCADCIHYDVCIFHIDESEWKKCLHFKNKADVVEVRHGKWKKVSEKYPRYVCTSCNHLYNNKEYKHCPNCGAKMDGKGDVK